MTVPSIAVFKCIETRQVLLLKIVGGPFPCFVPFSNLINSNKILTEFTV